MTTNQKPLRRLSKAVLFHYFEDKRVEGPSPDLYGDCTGLRGDCTDLEGNCSGLEGNCTGLRGDCTDLEGNLSDIPMSARPCNLSDWVEAGA